MSRTRNLRAGFTLVELLIAGMISALVLIAVYVVFIANTNQYYRQEQIVQMQESMRFAIEYLKNDLRNAGRGSVANGVALNVPNVTDPGYCGTPGLRGAQLFDDERRPAVVQQHGNGITPDRLRLMVDPSGGMRFTISSSGGDAVTLNPSNGQTSEEARDLLLGANQAAFEALFKAGYWMKIEATDGQFVVVPISEVAFNGGRPILTAAEQIACVGVPSFCRVGGCMVNPVQLVEYVIDEDQAGPQVAGEFQKTDLVRQVIHSTLDTPIAAERVVVAEFVVNLQVWGTYDTRADGAADPLLPADPDPTDDEGNWVGVPEAVRFNARPERIRRLNVVLARRSSREDAELRVAVGANVAAADRVAADLTWFDLDGRGGDPNRDTGLARVATAESTVETVNLVRFK